MYPNTTPYYQTQQAYQRPIMPQQLGLKGRPVSSIEEARASGIDFDGSIFYFPDLANRRIYTKQINLDGTATLNMYELKELPATAIEGNNFITRQEFNEALEALRNQLFSPQPQTTEETPALAPTETNFNF